jgi:putative drug exporter of the RND superfamily
MVPEVRVGLLGRLAGAAHRHRVLVLAIWLLAVVASVGAGRAVGGEFKADYTARGSDSALAQEVLATHFPASAGEQVAIVVRTDGAATDPAVRAALERLLADVATVPHVLAAPSPYGEPGAVSPDGRTVQATVRLDVPNPAAMPVADTERIIALAAAAQRPGIQIALGGQVVQAATGGEIGSEGIGLAAAALILLLVFGSVVAAGLPIVVAVVGLGVSASLVSVIAAAVDVPDWSTSLAAMMGIGVGVDYVLLLITRHREYLAAGLPPRQSVMATADTAGRSVLVAGTTVVVSMLGLFAMGLTAMRGAALVTILAVLVVMIAAVTLLPALLGFVGTRIDRLRLPLGRRSRTGSGRVPLAGRWAAGVQRRPWVALGGGLVLLGLLAAPFLGVRYGFPDAGNDRAGTTTRTAYDLVADGFGPGANGPLVLVTDRAGALSGLPERVAALPGVASVGPVRPSPDGAAALLSVIPAGSPQSAGTEALVHTLRDTLAGTGVHVGGVTAAAVDSNEDTASRLPLLIGGVVGLSFLLLLTVFRSLAVAIKAAVLNLLSLGAAFGVVALVLRGGWAGRLIGIDTPTPLPAFVPVLMFAVLFGLSMDYEVFLLSRIRERWLATGDNTVSVTQGLTATARVVTAAAAIMIAVFAAFIPSPQIFLKVIGVGMAAAILVDATLVRMLLVPATMQVLGRVTWWMPRWLDRALPRIRIEGAEEHAPAAPADPKVLQHA